MTMKMLPVVLLLLILAVPARAGELVLDNFSEGHAWCVEFEVWGMGSVETRTLCAEPQRRERFVDSMTAIGKMRIYRQDRGQAEGAGASSGKRYLPEGIYSPLCGYRVEINDSGSTTISKIN